MLVIFMDQNIEDVSNPQLDKDFEIVLKTLKKKKIHMGIVGYSHSN